MKFATGVLVLASLVEALKADFLSGYLNGKTFGAVPGPCTLKDPCRADAKNMPESVKNIETCICGDNWCCGKLGDQVKEGEFEIWDLQCSSLSVDAFDVSHIKNVGASQLEASFALRGVRQRCTFKMTFLNLFLQVTGSLGAFGVKMNAREGSYEFVQSASDPGSEITGSAIMRWVDSNAINNDIPEDIVIPDESCDMMPRLGLTISLQDNALDNINFCWNGQCMDENSFIRDFIADLINWSRLLSALANLLEGWFGGIVCEIIEETDYIERNNEPGFLNILWAEVKKAVNEAASAQPEVIRDADQDEYLLNKFDWLTLDMVNRSLDMANNSAAEFVSVSLNSWLGGLTKETPKRLVVNELIELITDPDGILFSGDLSKKGYDTFAEAGMADITVRINEFQLLDLNTFTKFKILDNGYGDEDGAFLPYARTFLNSVKMDVLGLQANLYVRLDRGEWVTKSCNFPPSEPATCDSDSFEFTFSFFTYLRDVSVDFAINTLFDPSMLDTVKVGQLTQIVDIALDPSDDVRKGPVAAFYYFRTCVAPAFHSLYLPSLSLSASEIVDPVVNNFGGTEGQRLNQLVEEITALFADATRGAMKSKLGGFMQGDGRAFANEVLDTYIVKMGRDRGLRFCRPLSLNGLVDEYTVDFREGIASFVYPLVNDAIGGNPIVNTNSDINDLVDRLLKFYEVKVPSLAIDSWDNTTDPPTRFPQGYWELNDEYQYAAKVPAYKSPANYLWFSQFSATNVNSIHRLTANFNDQLRDIGLQFDLGLGGALQTPEGPMQEKQPLLVNFTFDIKTDGSGKTSFDEVLDEKWNFNFIIEEFDFNFVMNEVVLEEINLKSLTLKQASHIPCMLQGLKSILFPKEWRSSSIKKLDFDVQQVKGLAPNSGVKIVDALHNVSSDFLDPDTADLSDPIVRARLRTQERFIAFINSLLRGGFGYLLDTISKIPEDYKDVTVATCDDVPSPLDEAPSLDFSAPNFTYFSEVCLADVDKTNRLPVNKVEDLYVVGYNSDVNEIYDFQRSSFFETIQQLVNTQETLERILFGLANSTDNLLSDYFELSKDENGNDQVDLLFPLSFLGLFLESDAVIDGLKLDGGIMQIQGFDKVVRKSYDILNPVGTMTLRNSFKFDEDTPLNIKIRSLWEMDNSAVGIDEPGKVQEWITSELDVRGLDIAFDLVLAIDPVAFGNLSLAHMLTVDEKQAFDLAESSLNCFLSTVYEGGIFLSYLDIVPTNITGPVITVDNYELLSPAVLTLFEATVELLKDFYQDAIPSICDNCLRQYTNDYARELWEEAQKTGACPDLEKIPRPPLEGENVFYRFNEAPDFLQFQTFFNEYFVPNDYGVFNKVIESATATTFFELIRGDEVRYEGVPIIYNSVTYGSFGFQVAQMNVANLNSFSYVRLFEPYVRTDIEQMEDEDRRRRLPAINATANPSINKKNIPYMTLTQFTIDGPLEIEADYDLNVTGFFKTDEDLRNNIRVKITASDVTFGLQMMMKVNLTKAMEVRFSSISTVEELPCLFVPVKELELQDFNLTTTDLKLEIECLKSCDFFAKYGLEKGSKINNENGAEIAGLLNSLINWSTSYVDSQGAQGAIDSFLEASEGTCARILGLLEEFANVPDSNKEDIATVLGIIFLGASGVGGLLSLALFPAHKKRRQVVMAKTLARYKSTSDEHEIAGIMAMVELRMKSLFQHPMTPIVAKYLLPLICILNVIGLVVAIVFSDAAGIVIRFTVIDQESNLVTLVPFTIISTINDIWNSGAWPLAILIAVASCAWPVVKNLLLVAFWFCPSTLIRPKTRGWWLEMLDILGKWSFLDVYVIVVMLAALRTYVKASYLSYTTFLADDFFIADVSVVPQRGIVLLCIVAAASLIVNHIIMVMHDRVVESNNVSEDKINGNYLGGKIPARAAAKRALRRHVFIGKDRNGLVRKVSPKGAIILLVVAVLSFLLIIVGLALPVISFKLNGLVGLLLELFEENPNADFETQLARKTYSIFSLGSNLSDAPTETAGDQLVVIFFQFLYYSCVLIGPVVCITLTLVLFFIPHSLKNLRSLLFWTKIASYWSAIDVLLVGLFATIIEIGPVTEFIVDFITNDICGYVKGAIAVIVEDPEVDGYCLDIVGSFEPGAAVLFLGVLMQLFSYYVITVLARAIIDDRYFAAYHQLRSDVRPKKLGRLARFTVRLFTLTYAASNDGIDGVSSFMDLDNDSEEIQYTSVEASACDKLSDWCCSGSKGEEAADQRIEAWQKRFGVNTPSTVGAASPASMQSANPAFVDPVSPSFSSGASSSPVVRPRSISSSSSNSVEV